ncbi:MAG: class I SAM-dependent methyltransferase [Flavobacteriales bacterium]|nr:class I SAM-dependent methyltransferase [Flavobacteriales bacterium]
MALLSHPARAYLRHLRKAGNRHDVHSPFVFKLVVDVLRKRTPLEGHAETERLRSALLRDLRTITVTDLGAGSRSTNHSERRVRDIARTALKPRRQAEQLARITHYFNPRNVLELGTSLGITTLYLARSVPEARVHTIEGCPAIATIAQENFNTRKTGNIIPYVGSFSDQLPLVLDSMDSLDLAFLDGHHAAAPTLDYFERCLVKAHNDTVFVLDDIHWSEDMERAWAAIKAHPRVTVTIDLYHFGIVFIRKEQQREDFVLRY